MIDGPALSVQRFDSGQALLDAAGDFLVEREAEHNLIFGICANLSADPGFPIAPPYLAAVSRGDRVVLASVMTPPWNLVLSWTDDPDALRVLAEDLDATGVRLPGTSGPVDTAHAFASVWCEPHGLVSQIGVSERIYRLEHVIPPTDVPGHARVATEADRDLLVDWVDAFLTEALERRSPEETRARPQLAPPRTGSASARSTRRPGCDATATRARSRPQPARPSSARGGGSSSCSRTCPTRRPTRSTRRSAIGR
jgi:hypothetical protein